MTPQEAYRSTDYARAVAAIMAALPLERAAEVYDFACFLQVQRASPSPIVEETDDWLNDSEELMQAEDAVWDAVYARHGDKFLTLREAARVEIDADREGFSRLKDKRRSVRLAAM